MFKHLNYCVVKLLLNFISIYAICLFVKDLLQKDTKVSLWQVF
jgi:hypothetical protein